jgi:OOP family OmpA-OmpF porin
VEEGIIEVPPPAPQEEALPAPEEKPEPEPKMADETFGKGNGKALEQPPPIQFYFDSTAIRPEYEEALRSLAKFLNETPYLNAVIEGHTDSIGTEGYNLLLSQQRADHVMNRLIALGVDPLRLTALGYGEGRLIAEDSTNENRQMNRRVQIILSQNPR